MLSDLFHCFYCVAGGIAFGFCLAFILSALVAFAINWVCARDPREGVE